MWRKIYYQGTVYRVWYRDDPFTAGFDFVSTHQGLISTPTGWLM